MAGDIELSGASWYGEEIRSLHRCPPDDTCHGLSVWGPRDWQPPSPQREREERPRSSTGLGGNPAVVSLTGSAAPRSEDQAAAAAPGPIPSMNSTLSHPTTENVRISSQKNLSLLIMHVQYGSGSSLRLLTCSNIAQNTLPPVVSNALSQHPYSPEVGVAQVRKPCPPPPTPSQTIPLP